MTKIFSCYFGTINPAGHGITSILADSVEVALPLMQIAWGPGTTIEHHEISEVNCYLCGNEAVTHREKIGKAVFVDEFTRRLWELFDVVCKDCAARKPMNYEVLVGANG